jgi:hypothetical protein
MWSASVVFMAIAAVLLLITVVMSVWPHERRDTLGWAGLFFVALSLLVQIGHPWGWA